MMMWQKQGPKNVLYHLYRSVPSPRNRRKSLIYKEFLVFLYCMFLVSSLYIRLPKKGLYMCVYVNSVN
jgi:ABC-type multidrug transport system permease subunit